MVKVYFLPQKIAVSVAPGSLLLDAARLAGISVDTPCDGSGSCGKCKARVSGEGIRPVRSEHQDSLTQEEIDSGWVLACQTSVLGDVEVELAAADARVALAGQAHAENDGRPEVFAVEGPGRVQRLEGNEVIDVHHRVDPVQLLALADSPHQGFVGAAVAGGVVAQGPVRIPQGAEGRKFAGLVHGHPAEPDGRRFDLPPQRLVVRGDLDRSRHQAHRHGGNPALEFGGNREIDHRSCSSAQSPAGWSRWARLVAPRSRSLSGLRWNRSSMVLRIARVSQGVWSTPPCRV